MHNGEKYLQIYLIKTMIKRPKLQQLTILFTSSMHSRHKAHVVSTNKTDKTGKNPHWPQHWIVFHRLLTLKAKYDPVMRKYN